MNAYKKYVTIDDPNHLVLSNLPFKAGQRVEVVMIAEGEERLMLAGDLRKLMHATQALPQSQRITEEEIAAEIAACRSRK